MSLEVRYTDIQQNTTNTMIINILIFYIIKQRYLKSNYSVPILYPFFNF